MLLKRLNQLPPFICRFIARRRLARTNRFKPLSHVEIAQRSGLPRSSVADLSLRISWEGVDLDVADRFAAACGVNLTKPGQHLRWLREGRFGHLKEGNAHQRKFFARLMAQRNGT
jgi:hypothetical protein